MGLGGVRVPRCLLCGCTLGPLFRDLCARCIRETETPGETAARARWREEGAELRAAGLAEYERGKRREARAAALRRLTRFLRRLLPTTRRRES